MGEAEYLDRDLHSEEGEFLDVIAVRTIHLSLFAFSVPGAWRTICHSVHTLKEGTIEGNTAVARLRLVHRDETHLAVLSADDEVFAELGLTTQRLRECYEQRAANCSV